MSELLKRLSLRKISMKKITEPKEPINITNPTVVKIC